MARALLRRCAALCSSGSHWKEPAFEWVTQSLAHVTRVSSPTQHTARTAAACHAACLHTARQSSHLCPLLSWHTLRSIHYAGCTVQSCSSNTMHVSTQCSGHMHRQIHSIPSTLLQDMRQNDPTASGTFSPMSATPPPLHHPMAIPETRVMLHQRDSSVCRLRQQNISPKKLNMVAKLVRRMHVDDALAQTAVLPKKAARIVYRALRSALCTAVNQYGMEGSSLMVDECYVGKGLYGKRVWYHARGRTGIRKKYYSHLTIVLKPNDAVKRSTQVIRSMFERRTPQPAVTTAA